MKSVGVPVSPVAVRLGLHRQRFRHETNLHVRPDAALKIGVENAVHDFPIVNRISLRVLGVGIGRSPLERVGALASD